MDAGSSRSSLFCVFVTCSMPFYRILGVRSWFPSVARVVTRRVTRSICLATLFSKSFWITAIRCNITSDVLMDAGMKWISISLPLLRMGKTMISCAWFLMTHFPFVLRSSTLHRDCVIAFQAKGLYPTVSIIASHGRVRTKSFRLRRFIPKLFFYDI